jgi:L-2,4-diaminobutyric acid acetyltransferase
VFVWQIGVDESARGRGVGSGLLSRLVEQPACTDVAYLEATVTPSNEPSRRLFLGFARKRGATPHISDGYPSALFPDDAHEPEQLFRIGPLRS